MTSTLDAALRYAAQRRPVFPCHAAADAGHCTCGNASCASPAKHPRTRNGLKDATTDAKQIRTMWERLPDSNVGMVTGAPSRLVVLDVDDHDSLHELEHAHGNLPITASTETPRGGQHYMFRHPGTPVPCSAGKVAPGIDVRGDGGYVLMPPSAGITGRRYEVDQSCPLADVPGWLLDRITVTEHAARAPAAVDEWLNIIGGTHHGKRNVSLARLVGHLLRRYVHVDLVAEIAHLVNQHRFRPPLERDEVDKILESIASRELQRQRISR